MLKLPLFGSIKDKLFLNEDSLVYMKIVISLLFLTSLSIIYKQLPYEEPKLVFCHNDLSPQNIIYDSISRNVALLHLEYADINFQALEIARHFYTLRLFHF